MRKISKIQLLWCLPWHPIFVESLSPPSFLKIARKILIPIRWAFVLLASAFFVSYEWINIINVVLSCNCCCSKKKKKVAIVVYLDCLQELNGFILFSFEVAKQQHCTIIPFCWWAMSLLTSKLPGHSHR